MFVQKRRAFHGDEIDTLNLNSRGSVQGDVGWEVGLVETELSVLDEGLLAQDVGAGAPRDVAIRADHQTGEDVVACSVE